ncbi:MAG: DMT family transporter [Deltaproteobacteria bacterium]|nr:MAG: DMT family transporter [Deltaproteobacteria bacterium]
MPHGYAVLLMVLVTLLWSTAGVVSRHFEVAAGFEINFWRSSFNALTLSMALTVMRGPRLWRQFFTAPAAMWISGVCWGFMFTAFMMALTITTVANVLVVMAIGPLITALLAHLFLRHHLAPATWLAIVSAGVGIVWMFLEKNNGGVSLLGSLVALMVPLAMSINFIVLQKVGLDRKTAGGSAGAMQDMLPAVLIGAVLSAVVTLPLALPLQASVHDLGLLAMLGVFQLAVPCLLVVRLTRELTAPEITLLSLLEVIFGVSWAWLWAGEQPSLRILQGGALVIGAMILNEMVRIVRQRRSLRRMEID